jgi:hypothetical protein
MTTDTDTRTDTPTAPPQGRSTTDGNTVTDGSTPLDGTDADLAEPTAADLDAADMELPFAWENSPGHPDPGDRDTVFRFPSADDPEPAARRLLGMSLYASLLGLVGLAVGVRGIVAIMGGNTPGWYEPTLAAAGLACVALVVAAFLSIHRRVLPWLLLLGAAAPLAANIVATTRTL